MIIRVWTAHATPEGAAQCQARFAEQMLPRLRQCDGYRGASVLRRLDGNEVELVLLTRWESIESIRSFAGDDIERAVVAEDAKAILTGWDERVLHYEVSLEDGASASGASR
jgi:heme-degrading monooxygenase HmoA